MIVSLAIPRCMIPPIYIVYSNDPRRNHKTAVLRVDLVPVVMKRSGRSLCEWSAMLMHGSVRANVEIETRSRVDVSEARNDIADNNECGTRGVHDTKVLSRTGEVSCMKRISGLRTAAAGVGSKIVIQGPGYYKAQ